MNMVYFHSIYSGIQFLDKHNDYFMDHELLEMTVKGNITYQNQSKEDIRNQFVDKYKKSIRELLPSEKIILSYLLSFSCHFLKIIQNIQFHSLSPLESKVLYTYKTIIDDISPSIYNQFGILIVRNMEWSYPRTLGDTIILSDKWIIDMILDYRNKNSYGLQRKIQTLIHEHIHLIQRMNRQSFNTIYERFDFYPITQDALNKIKSNEDYMKNKVTNPDTPGYYQYTKGYNSFIPSIILRNKEILPIAIMNNGQIIELNKMKEYNDIYKSLGQPYHPDEIFAEVLCNLYMKKQ
jgi:hypothetical protein